MVVSFQSRLKRVSGHKSGLQHLLTPHLLHSSSKAEVFCVVATSPPSGRAAGRSHEDDGHLGSVAQATYCEILTLADLHFWQVTGHM